MIVTGEIHRKGFGKVYEACKSVWLSLLLLDIMISLLTSLWVRVRRGLYEEYTICICSREPDRPSLRLALWANIFQIPEKEHCAGVNWILRYLRGLSKVCLCSGSDNLQLGGFIESYWGGDMDSRRSTSDYLLTFAGEAWISSCYWRR